MCVTSLTKIRSAMWQQQDNSSLHRSSQYHHGVPRDLKWWIDPAQFADFLQLCSCCSRSSFELAYIDCCKFCCASVLWQSFAIVCGHCTCPHFPSIPIRLPMLSIGGVQSLSRCRHPRHSRPLVMETSRGHALSLFLFGRRKARPLFWTLSLLHWGTLRRRWAFIVGAAAIIHLSLSSCTWCRSGRGRRSSHGLPSI